MDQMLYFSISHMCYNKDYLVLMLTSLSSVIRCTLNLFPEVMQYTKSNMIYNIGALSSGTLKTF